MKQGSFIVEFVQFRDTVLYIVRSTNGKIVEVCDDVERLSIFFDETEEKILNYPHSSTSDGKA